MKSKILCRYNAHTSKNSVCSSPYSVILTGTFLASRTIRGRSPYMECSLVTKDPFASLLWHCSASQSHQCQKQVLELLEAAGSA